MRATVMHGAGDVRIENVPDPTVVEPTDAVVRVTRGSICGSDLWPYKLMEPSERGRVMGLYAQALIGVGPLGAMQAGALATLLGAPWAMAIGATVAGAVVVATRLLRPTVFQRPALPEPDL